MKTDNPFDRKIEAQKGIPEKKRDAAIELTATLDLCWAAAQSVFEEKALPEHAIALLPIFTERADVLTAQAQERYRSHMEGVEKDIEGKSA